MALLLGWFTRLLEGRRARYSEWPASCFGSVRTYNLTQSAPLIELGMYIIILSQFLAHRQGWFEYKPTTFMCPTGSNHPTHGELRTLIWDWRLQARRGHGKLRARYNTSHVDLLLCKHSFVDWG